MPEEKRELGQTAYEAFWHGTAMPCFPALLPIQKRQWAFIEWEVIEASKAGLIEIKNIKPE